MKQVRAASIPPVFLWALMFFAIVISTNAFTLTNLIAFKGTNGAYPEAGLLLSGNTLYGTTAFGGTNGRGNVFRVNTDGTGYTNLHNFAVTVEYGGGTEYTNSDGANPKCDLLMISNVLYGTAYQGGLNGWGCLFKLNTDGSGFTNFYNFTGNGENPNSGLTWSSNTLALYGVTQNGGDFGASSAGTLFKINTDGTGFANLAAFSTFGINGSDPSGPLALVGNTLYGMTFLGGSNNTGTIFAINTDGTGFNYIYSFAPAIVGTNVSGMEPYDGLLAVSNTLYGTASSGGSTANGTIFSISTNGANFTVLHNFTGGNAQTNGDGELPTASLTLYNNVLYGTTEAGGAGNGTIFSLNTDGSGYTNLYDFSNPVTDTDPQGVLTVFNNVIYGATYTAEGAIFALYPYDLPNITAQPAGSSLVAGANAGFVVSATGTPPLYYVWQKNGTNLADGGNISGSATTNLVVSDISSSDGGAYSVLVTNLYGAVVSSNAILVVNPSVVITAQPASQIAGMGTNVSFTVAATGPYALGYQWQKNGTNLSDGGNILGSATTNLLVSNVTSNDAATYSVIVTNAHGLAVSSNATLTVYYAPFIASQPGNLLLPPGSTARFNVVVYGQATLAYQWLKNSTNLTDGGNISGSGTANLVVGNISSNDAAIYSVLITNNSGSVLSSNASLTLSVQIGNWVQAYSLSNYWSSIAVSADGSKVVSAAGNLYATTNSGATWSPLSGAYPTLIGGSADGSVLLAAQNIYGYNGQTYVPQTVNLSYSTNSGSTWNFTVLPAVSGQTPCHVAALAVSADGKWMTVAVNEVLNGSFPNEMGYGYVYYGTVNTFGSYSFSPEFVFGERYWTALTLAADGTKLMGFASSSTASTSNRFQTTTNISLSFNPDAVASSADGSRLYAADPYYSDGLIHVSTNWGVSWSLTGAASNNWVAIATSADGTRLVAAANPSGLYTSTDSGATWVNTTGPGNGVNNWAAVATSADGAKSYAVVNETTNYSQGLIYTSQTNPAVILRLATLTASNALSWIVPSTNLLLQQSAALSPANWQSVTNPPVLNYTNLQNQVVLPPSGPTGFYRLKSP